jgi:hypothetical protein
MLNEVGHWQIVYAKDLTRFYHRLFMGWDVENVQGCLFVIFQNQKWGDQCFIAIWEDSFGN